MLNSKKKLFCAFIDFKSAFDKVWRNGLWIKLLNHGINGKCLGLIQNMYKQVKSCVIANGMKSNFFSCNIGVRQGENLSPILFSLFLNDLEQFLASNGIDGITCKGHELDDEFGMYLKIFLLLYADDTIIICENEQDLHKALNVFNEYCKEWKLTVNVKKTKVVIFSKRKTMPNVNFKLNNILLEIVNEYKYLGIFMSRTGSFLKAKKHIASQATNAMYSLLSKVRQLSLPIDIQIDLFNKTVKPILLYGAEIWGFGNNEIIERVQLKYYKNVLNLKKSTPTVMLYGELGIHPIEIDIHSKTISFWTKLVKPENRKLSSCMYYILMSIQSHSATKFNWLIHLKQIFIDCGQIGIWSSQQIANPKWLIVSMKQKLQDLYVQKWNNKVHEDTNYKLFKETINLEKYMIVLQENEYKPILAYRTRNHKLPIETGRWSKTDRHLRICNLCNEDLGDEMHYLLSCKRLKNARKLYVKPYYYTRPNILKYGQLLNSHNLKELKNLAKFISIILAIFSN